MTLIDRFQDLVAQVPDLVQPLILALAGAVPFIEGEGAAAIGIVGGIHPVVAVAAGVVGNFLCVAVLVLLSSGARTAVVTRRRESVRAREAVA
ncbi:small multidrug efflux protein, partial [Microbacterium sp. zg.Y909]|nr:small multidrug efflux protein [Microbacterium sp. zg.Y909]